MIGIVMVVLAAANAASACSRSFPTFKVRPDFRVIVNDRGGKPVEGTIVKIVFAEPTLEKVAEEITDKEGKVTFRNLMVSDYWISGERAGVSSTVGKLWPVKDESGAAEITLTWPMNPVVSVRSISGRFLQGGLPLVGADLLLRDTISGKELAERSTDEKGNFSFPRVDVGLYALHVDEHRDCSRYLCKIKGTILVEVKHDANEEELPTYTLIMTSCGLAASRGRDLFMFE